MVDVITLCDLEWGLAKAESSVDGWDTAPDYAFFVRIFKLSFLERSKKLLESDGFAEAVVYDFPVSQCFVSKADFSLSDVESASSKADLGVEDIHDIFLFKGQLYYGSNGVSNFGSSVWEHEETRFTRAAVSESYLSKYTDDWLMFSCV